MSKKPQEGKPAEKIEKPEADKALEKLPPEVRDKLKEVKEKLDKFKSQLLEKFDKYIVGIALLPPPRPPMLQGLPPDIAKEEEKRYNEEKDKFHTLVLIDDTEPHKMSKQELRDKLISIMDTAAKQIDEKILPQPLLLTELWQNCYDAKYEWLQLISMSAFVHDTGMLSAIKIAEIHKGMVLKKFERYIVAYALAGSLVQGRATKDSDIDVFIVVDDTDVKKMTRYELREKLRAIIIGMGIHAGELTDIKNKINIQVYILTDFWEWIKEANPVMFTFLRDGVPFYDRGIFMPWKQLLKMGRIKPSQEAIDMYMSAGEQMLERVKFKLRDVGMEDLFQGIHAPTQAAIMLYGLPPPAPKETCDVLREVFVKKEKLLEEEFVKTLEKVIQTRKDLEHGVKKDITGKEIDELMQKSESYLKRIKKLFTQIERVKEEESVLSVYETVVTTIRDVLRLEGVDKVADIDLIHKFEDTLISTGKVPAKYSRVLHEVAQAKKDYEAGKLTKMEVDKVKKGAQELIKALVELIQHKRAKDLDKARIKVKYGQKAGEVTLLGDTAFIVRNVDAEERTIEKAKINPDGSLGVVETSTLEEFEKSLAKIQLPAQVLLKEKVFESLKKVFGPEMEVVIG